MSSTKPEGVVNRAAASQLSGAIGKLLGELLQTRYTLRSREAELAAAVPLIPHRQEGQQLAVRLEGVLRAGVEAVEADAAALYLLDDNTTELKLRSCWGLPFEKFLAPARPLAGATADLEALLGHAVVLNNPTIRAAWNVPENFPAAVCLPVSTSTTLLGTLWVFSNSPRDFTDSQTNLLEVVAGRLAVELEREILLNAKLEEAKFRKQLTLVERLQHTELPLATPIFSGWQMAGETFQAEGIGGAFHDWFSLPNGLLALAVGQAAERGLGGVLSATALRIALRSHAPYYRMPERVLQQTNLTLWTASAGDRRLETLLAMVETSSGKVRVCAAGRPFAMLVARDDCRLLDASRASPLGKGPERMFAAAGYRLPPGGILLFATSGFYRILKNTQGKEGFSRLSQLLRDRLQLPAAEIAKEVSANVLSQKPGQDLSFIVLKRSAAIA